MKQLNERIRAVMALDSSAIAVIFKGRKITWGELRLGVEACDRTITEAGLAAGAKIGCLLRNSAQHLTPIISALTTERCLVTLNPHLPDERLAEDIREMRCPIVFAASRDWERPAIVQAMRDVGAVGISLGDDWSQLASPVPSLPTKVDASKFESAKTVAIYMLTSGTTGTPKRVPLKASSFEIALQGALAYEPESVREGPPQLSTDTIVHFTSFVHIGGIFNAMRSILCGRQLYLLEKFNVGEWADAIETYKPRAASLPPAALRMVLDEKVSPEKLASLRAVRSSTAPLNQDDADQFERLYGAPVLQNYGATEFAGGVAGWTMQDYRKFAELKRGSVGRIHDGVEARIVDPVSGEPLRFDEEGILELRSHQFSEDNDWVRTSDRAVLDSEQFLWIKGRADDAIIRGGFKVHPPELVEALERHPAVREAVVVGLADPRLGAVPAAAVMLKSDAEEPSEAELIDWVRGQLTPYQAPVLIRVVDDVPRTVSLKPALMKVRDMLNKMRQAKDVATG